MCMCDYVCTVAGVQLRCTTYVVTAVQMSSCSSTAVLTHVYARPPIQVLALIVNALCYAAAGGAAGSGSVLAGAVASVNVTAVT